MEQKDSPQFLGSSDESLLPPIVEDPEIVQHMVEFCLSLSKALVRNKLQLVNEYRSGTVNSKFHLI